MQQRAIGLVANALQQMPLFVRRIGEQGERLFAMTGQHYVIESLAVDRIGADLDAIALAPHLAHGGRKANVGEIGGDSVHISSRASNHGAPLRPS